MISAKLAHIAAAGRRLLYSEQIGLGFLATVWHHDERGRGLGRPRHSANA